MKKIVSLVVFIICIVACSSSDDGATPDTGNGSGGETAFNRAEMLTNLADNIIIPSYQALNTDLGALETAKDNFITTPNQANLDALRGAWLTAYKAWQHVEAFNIGLAEQTGYYFQMNTYPVNVTDVENNVTNGNYDLGSTNNNDAVGFPALDYLLYGLADSDPNIIAKYDTDTNAAKYTTYLSDLITQMQTLTQDVLSDWTNTYRNTFVASTANTATSATNKFINDFIFYYEKGLRANKIGIPAGNFSATPLPDRVEGYYNQQVSKELALEALDAVIAIFNGTEFGGSNAGESFKTYLISLDRADLATLISNQFNTARGKIQELDANFATQINSDNTKMTQAYDALQAAVVLLKVDMLQAFDISVDFVDADGD
ncbi:iron-regulated protein A [Kordia sp. SMS9]|uniref:imelysin family protein n=1 Tax=Kordia sp. SMS9 TaxID=2282170 RepID=UPI000E0DE751|nr:imelysin family protein [Kordia sp. SMS9]AXG71939.1 iron-regulated protein A [Kordia sp. SMS9]